MVTADFGEVGVGDFTAAGIVPLYPAKLQHIKQ